MFNGDTTSQEFADTICTQVAPEFEAMAEMPMATMEATAEAK